MDSVQAVGGSPSVLPSWARWPLPALLTWALAWAAYLMLGALGAPILLALTAASTLGLGLSIIHDSRWRRLMVAGGFPLSFLLSGSAAAIPGWAWLLPLALLALAYPRHAWRDAPLFPTPRDALLELARLAPLPTGARVLDAGCGLGAGLLELRRAYPEARISGIEWSPLLARLAAWRCGWAEVRRGDMWAQSWAEFDLVYLFQRPESMQQALQKARAELRPGAWLASLDFELPEVAPLATVALGPRHRLLLYRPQLKKGAERSI